MMHMVCRSIVGGKAEGVALVTDAPIGFLGGVDPDTGRIIDSLHPLYGESIAGKVLVFPFGKGSTVGSYTIYRLKMNGLAPVGMINADSEAIVAVGALIAEIPMVDQVDVSMFETGMNVRISGEELWID